VCSPNASQVKRSKAEGSVLQEAIEINSSLMTLGQVIDSLVQKKVLGVFVCQALLGFVSRSPLTV